MKINNIMSKKVITVTVNSPLSEIADLLFNNKITGVPVVDENKHVIGIVTEYDLLSRNEHIHIPTYIKLLRNLKTAGNKKEITKKIQSVLSLKAEDIMTKPVVTIVPQTHISEVARIFTEKHINPLPVVNIKGVLVGIISRADIIRLFRKGKNF
jgi:CBS domain-containing protein